MKKIFFAAALAGAAMLASCGGNKGGIKMGSLSDFDSLSYAIGANVGYGLNYQMKDIPFDYEAMDKGIKEGALGKSSQDHDEALGLLRDYFMTKRSTRARDIAAKRAEADSIRLAGGDTTKVEYPVADAAMFESEEEREQISYAFGNDLGFNIAQSGMPVQLVWVCEAMQNVRDNNAKMAENEVNQYLQYYFMIKVPAENAAASKAWLEKIEKKSGVKKTESGLLYKVVKAGTGEKVQSNQRAKVSYKGTLIDGTQFDANASATFSPAGVVKGFGEGLQLMQKGGKYILYIPAELGYGVRGGGDKIPTNSVLVFEVEVLDIVK